MIERVTSGEEHGAYSAAVVAEGRMIFVSGQGPVFDRETKCGEIEDETELTLRNVVAAVEAAGGTKDSIARCNCFLADIGSFDRFNAAYRQFFEPRFPARTTVGATLTDGIKVEIDAIAVLV